MTALIVFLALLLMLPPASMTDATGTPRHHLRRALQAATPPCNILTQSVFDALAPPANRDGVYTYTGLCTAIDNWNTDNPGDKIFVSGTEAEQRAELAAFLGHTLHESGDFQFPREITQCGTTAETAGTLYCQPEGYTTGQGAYADPYCSAAHSTTTNPDGCDCGAVPNTSPSGYESDLLFFGRGPIQLSWNYNYIDAGAALNVSLCANPDLVATDSTVAWGTAIWFWMKNTGAVGTTCHDAIVTNGDFGGSLNTINGGLECPASGDHVASVISRLDDYCRAVTELGAEPLLSFDGCNNLAQRHTDCLAGNSCPNCVGVPLTAAPTSSPTPPVTAASPVVPPTTSPSKAPTKGPSSSPTPPAPTSSPSTSPSSSPTKSPTNMPTSSPTTDSPTASPTTSAPTSSPSPGPTQSPVPCLWYTNGQTCVNDCLDLGTTYTTQAECCNDLHQWNLNECLGITGSPTISPTTSPPSVSPTGAPTTSPTTGAPSVPPTPGPTGSPVPCLWYSNGQTCVNDCLENGKPTYTTLEGCCNDLHQWNLNECLGITGSPTISPTTSPPSVSPTGAPTASPTTGAPSVPPTPGPTKSPSPCMYYPPPAAIGGTSCLSDCANDEWTPAYDTLDGCCSVHFSWIGAYDICMGITESPTASPTSPGPTLPAPTKSPTPCLYYPPPAAIGGDSCLNDCANDEWTPAYETLDGCCSVHFSWIGAYDICMGFTDSPTMSPTTPGPTLPAPTKSPTPCLYYPPPAAIGGDSCLNDCANDEWTPAYETLDGCCSVHFSWIGAYDICMGFTDSPTASPTTPGPTLPAPTKSPTPCLYYPPPAAIGGDTCLNDCANDEWTPAHETLELCCSAHFNWIGAYGVCMGITESPTASPTTPGPTLPAPTKSPTPCLYYTNQVTCVNDCQQGDDPSWPPTYNSLEACCNVHHFWQGANGIDQCLGLTDSPTTTPTTSAPQVCQFYNDWSGTCVNNCAEEDWDRKYGTIDECCTTEYTWAGAYEICMGITDVPTLRPTTPMPTLPVPTKSPAPCKFYNDYNGNCPNDCLEDEWTVVYDTLELCCANYINTASYDSCMGITGAPTLSPTTPAPTAPRPTRSPAPCQYYNSYDGTCINDCNEGEWPPPLYDTLDNCCTAQYTWAGAYEICMGITDAPTTSPTTPAPMAAQLSEAAPLQATQQQTVYYVDWDAELCVENCDPSTGPHCKGPHQHWQVPHAGLGACCEAHLDFRCPDSVFPCSNCTQVPF